MKAIDVKSITCIDFNVENNDKDPKLKLVIMKECQDIKTFFERLQSKLVCKNFCN